MKKSEYLHELKENLETQLTQEEMKDILADYESFFVSGREDGKTDDEISNELGSPAFLAKSLLDERNSKTTEPTDKYIASTGKRFCAYLIDSIIAVIPSVVLSFVVGAIALPYLLLLAYPSPAAGALIYTSYSVYTKNSGSMTLKEIKPNGEEVVIEQAGNKPETVNIVMAIGALLFYICYSPICSMVLRGQTIGKRIMRIKIKRTNTTPVSKSVILSREFIGKVIINSIPIIPFISLFTILFTKEQKALHDMLSDTIVVDVRE